jgi:hypothetical protein
MNKFLAISLIVLVAFLGLATFKLFDVSMVIDDARMETRAQRAHALLLRSLLRNSVQGRTREDVLKLFVGDLPGDNIVRNDENQIEIGGVIFVLKDGAVTNVRLVDE